MNIARIQACLTFGIRFRRGHAEGGFVVSRLRAQPVEIPHRKPENVLLAVAEVCEALAPAHLQSDPDRIRRTRWQFGKLRDFKQSLLLGGFVSSDALTSVAT